MTDFVEQQANAWREITKTVSNPNLLYANGGSVNSAASSASRTNHLTQEIPKLLRAYNIQTMIDVPCGDMIWIRRTDLSFLYSYIGMDLIPEFIRKHRIEFRFRRNMAFRQANLLDDKLMLQEVDLIMCRDFLYCLPTHRILDVINKFRQSGSRFLLATTYAGTDNYPDIDGVEYRWEGYMERAYDLTEPPFYMKQIDEIEEIPAPKGVVAQPHSLGLFMLNGVN
jgi:hypothetical protein